MNKYTFHEYCGPYENCLTERQTGQSIRTNPSLTVVAEQEKPNTPAYDFRHKDPYPIIDSQTMSSMRTATVDNAHNNFPFLVNQALAQIPEFYFTFRCCDPWLGALDEIA